MSTAVPEKKVVFNGETAEKVDALSFDVKPHIMYPMEGGTAFITFEEEEGVLSSLQSMSWDYSLLCNWVSLGFSVLLLSC